MAAVNVAALLPAGEVAQFGIHGVRVVAKEVADIAKRVSGGTYRMFCDAISGGEVHHMPMKSALKAANHPLGVGSKAPNGPAISMTAKDHRELPSSQVGSEVLSAKQAAAIRPGPGGLDDAFLLAVDEVQTAFGSKYDEAILEAMDFLP
jgi:hypothetical protein